MTDILSAWKEFIPGYSYGSMSFTFNADDSEYRTLFKALDGYGISMRWKADFSGEGHEKRIGRIDFDDIGGKVNIRNMHKTSEKAAWWAKLVFPHPGAGFLRTEEPKIPRPMWYC
jgi:hypothetical protein